MNNQNTNWKYLLILIVFVAVVSGGILIYQPQWSLQREIKTLEIKLPQKQEKTIEVLLRDLKEGRNEINKAIIEKIKPNLLCEGSSPIGILTAEEKNRERIKIGEEKGIVIKCSFSS